MNIVIIGAGNVGFDLGKILSESHHDVTILDRDKQALNRVSEKLDVLIVEGNATSARDLIKANVKDSDIVIAATSVDEVNMIASMLSKRLGAKKVIARIRNDELTSENAPIKAIDLGIDVVIHPEYSAALEIVQLLKRASASDVINLADGKLQLVGIKIESHSPLVQKSLIEYAQDLEPVIFRIVAIYRGGLTIMPKGHIRIQKNDQIFVLAKIKDIPELVKSTGNLERKLSKIIISGGSAIGELIAKMLTKQDKKWNIKLIEPDYNKANELAQELKNVLVLHGNPTDPDLLAQEGIAETDAFIAVTDDEESNIISCLMAKHLNVYKTVALVSKPDYIPLSQAIGLDTAINIKLSVANEIYRHVRKREVLSVASLHGIEAEVLELRANFSSKIANKPLYKIKLPHGVVIGAIIRSNDVEIATGNSVIQEHDSVIVFCLTSSVDEIIALF